MAIVDVGKLKIRAVGASNYAKVEFLAKQDNT